MCRSHHGGIGTARFHGLSAQRGVRLFHSRQEDGRNEAALSYKRVVMCDDAQMGTVHYVTGNVLDATEQYLVHQTNCVTRRAAHLSADVFAKFPYADIYSEHGKLGVLRADGRLRHQPGTIEVRGDGNTQRLVINLLGQLKPGKCASTTSYVRGLCNVQESPLTRQAWFLTALCDIAALPGITSLAFPHGIGCGAAGGDWAVYRTMLNQFAADHAHIRVCVYRLPLPNVH